jgi:hypothetical protein
MNTPKQLHALYPYMFDGPNIGISIPRGWIKIFAQLCEDIDHSLGIDKQDFHFTQCKEKFGGARWYWSMEGRAPATRIHVISEIAGVNDLGRSVHSRKSPSLALHALFARINELVEAATAQTRQACIVCSSSATIDHDGGWVLMLCPDHALQRRTGGLTDIWFEEDEQ